MAPAIFDADGTLYVGGNGGDHDMNDATAKSGGIYRVVLEPDGQTASLVLMAAAPESNSNDGAADPPQNTYPGTPRPAGWSKNVKRQIT